VRKYFRPGNRIDRTSTLADPEKENLQPADLPQLEMYPAGCSTTANHSAGYVLDQVYRFDVLTGDKRTSYGHNQIKAALYAAMRHVVTNTRKALDRRLIQATIVGIEEAIKYDDPRVQSGWTMSGTIVARISLQNLEATP
jgi:hypothetical protein